MLTMDHGRCVTKGERRVNLFQDLRKTLVPFDVVHVTRDSDTTLKIKVQLEGVGAYCGGLPHSLFICNLMKLPTFVFMHT